MSNGCLHFQQQINILLLPGKQYLFQISLIKLYTFLLIKYHIFYYHYYYYLMAPLSQCPTATTVVGHCQQHFARKHKDEDYIYSWSSQTYLYKCVFTLSIEVKPLVIKCDIMTISIDPTNCITLIAGAYKFSLTAIAEETPSRNTFEILFVCYFFPCSSFLFIAWEP